MTFPALLAFPESREEKRNSCSCLGNGCVATADFAAENNNSKDFASSALIPAGSLPQTRSGRHYLMTI
jgi:hypothetical protein